MLHNEYPAVIVKSLVSHYMVAVLLYHALHALNFMDQLAKSVTVFAAEL